MKKLLPFIACILLIEACNKQSASNIPNDTASTPIRYPALSFKFNDTVFNFTNVVYSDARGIFTLSAIDSTNTLNFALTVGHVTPLIGSMTYGNATIVFNNNNDYESSSTSIITLVGVQGLPFRGSFYGVVYDNKNPIKPFPITGGIFSNVSKY
jgi:hypothetical protein